VNIAKEGEVTIKTPSKMWNGSEKLTFTVTDPEGRQGFCICNLLREVYQRSSDHEGNREPDYQGKGSVQADRTRQLCRRPRPSEEQAQVED
jgi:hypothetical protein